MSKPLYDENQRVISRNGEYYEVTSSYAIPFEKRLAKDFGAALMVDVDELYYGKPRRFFDTMLSAIEYQRDNDLNIDKGNRRQYWQDIIKGCELWLSAVENGLYSEVIRLATPLDKEGKDLQKEFES